MLGILVERKEIAVELLEEMMVNVFPDGNQASV
jgi:hypothetical protein